MAHARTFSRQLGSTLPTHNQPQVPPQIIISDSEDPHKPIYHQTLHWKNSLLDSVQSSHTQTSTSFHSLLTKIKTIAPRSKVLLGLLCLLSLVSVIAAASGVRPDILTGGDRSPYTRTHYVTHNRGRKFDHNREKRVKREEPPVPIPVPVIGLTPKKIAPVVHTEEKKVKRGEAPVMRLTPRKSIPREVGGGTDVPVTISTITSSVAGSATGMPATCEPTMCILPYCDCTGLNDEE
ncbi:hypothetical protein SBOR_4661 [Sclerotinia borealis F-4128]|uniref:Uncharacterized protein n=1 Tax=Sclerotinia borealis (strain F-4128) TaxID=1432307 RepID=W9CDV8_SCLBF|nr:hypothetical protein SBOR_4661 [Sclerotinia borealis F-4128]